MRWSHQEQLVVGLAIAAAVVAGGLLLVLRRSPPPVRFVEPPLPTEIVVQVDGEVIQPGLYRVTRGARVEDAVQAAGGVTAEADLSAVNRARILRDGDRVTVPARAGASPGAGSPARVIDLNTATAADLQTLPGIGPVLAGRIIAYRTRHGPFQRVEDLLQVEGIGARLLQHLRSTVIVQ